MRRCGSQNETRDAGNGRAESRIAPSARTLAALVAAAVLLGLVLLCAFDLARGIWLQHRVALAVLKGTRFISTDSRGCMAMSGPCAVTLGQVAERIRQSAAGLDPGSLRLTFTPEDGAAVSCRLSECVRSAAEWPPRGAREPGMHVEIAGRYPFRPAMASLWPGAVKPAVLREMDLPSAVRERIQF